MKKPKQKPCRYSKCKKMFDPWSSTQVTCHTLECAVGYDNEKKAKKAAKEQATAKAAFKLDDKKTQRNLAQKYFNRYIRLRDGQTCISCKRNQSGKIIHAGHFRTTGAAPQLRFNELNCNSQCAHCNTYLSGNLLGYKKGLIKKIGIDKVEWLEGPHEPVKYTAADYVEIKKKYLKICNDLLDKEAL